MPPAVDRRVAAPQDFTCSVNLDLDPVTVAPDTRIGIEIGLAVTRSVFVAPKEQRHRWRWAGADEFAHLADYWSAVRTPRLDGSAQLATLELAGRRRQVGISSAEGPANIGAA